MLAECLCYVCTSGQQTNKQKEKTIRFRDASQVDSFVAAEIRSRNGEELCVVAARSLACSLHA